MATNLRETEREPSGLSVERPARPAAVGWRIRQLRRSASTPVSFRAMAIGAVVGPIVGFAAEMIFGADDQYIAHHVIIAIVLGGQWGLSPGR